KYARAKAAQPAWARLPLADRLERIRRFREAVARDADQLAATLTAEVGKPVSQSRNELKGVLPRIDFFLEKTAQVVGEETVFRDGGPGGGMEERIAHEPLGVIANI